MASWLVIGGTGMLGQDVVAQARAAGHAVVATGSRDLDIRDIASLQDLMQRCSPSVVVNCAAYTAVDAAETDEAGAFALNAVGARNVALAAREHKARLIHVSTDYVFDGTASEPYAVDAPLNPRSAYGRTKAAGEWAVRLHHPDALIVRTAWLYGIGGGNFVRTMLTLAESKPTLDVVNDQIGQPTWTRDVADLVLALLDAGAPGGAYHATSSGRASWFDLAQETYRIARLDPQRIRSTTSEAFVRPALRPSFSVLASSGWAPRIGDWRERLAASGVAEGGR